MKELQGKGNPYEAFVYLWFDTIARMFYLGKHYGQYTDNYAHSSSLMESFTMNKKPDHMHRRVLATGSKSEIDQLEIDLLLNRKSKGLLGTKYYNIMIGDPRAGAPMNGKFNTNYKDGRYEGRLSDPELYRKLDRENHIRVWPEKRKHDTHRQMFYYYKRVKNKEKAEIAWKCWYNAHPFKDDRCNRKSLWKSDTFEMWYNRKGNEIDFRDN